MLYQGTRSETIASFTLHKISLQKSVFSPYQQGNLASLLWGCC